MAFISDSQTILGLLEQNAEHSAGRSFASFEGQEIRTRELRDKARQTAYLLAKQGVRPGDRVAVMLDNHLDNLVLFFALVWVGAIHVPVNTRLRYDSLRYLVEHSRPKLIIVEDRYVTHLPPQEGVVHQRLCVTHKASEGFEWSMDQDALKGQGSDYPGPADVQPSDVISIMYTSGTTGPPKGVKVTDKMLRASAFASAKASGAVTGDIFLVWEPLYHIGALQLLPLALGVGVQLALVAASMRNKYQQLDGAILREMPAEGEPSLEEIENNALIGDPAKCTDQLIAEIEAIEPSHISLFVQFGSLPQTAVMKSSNSHQRFR